jgi:hypothetical protein
MIILDFGELSIGQVTDFGVGQVSEGSRTLFTDQIGPNPQDWTNLRKGDDRALS